VRGMGSGWGEAFRRKYNLVVVEARLTGQFCYQIFMRYCISIDWGKKAADFRLRLHMAFL
jgi:hypothetical protein